MNISVVIPTYNGSALISEALDSVFAQTLLPEEIIVVDDGSTDETPKLVRRAAKRSPVRTQVIRLLGNSGSPASPLNVGIAEARGRLIALLDQDDVMLPEKLRCQVEAIDRYPRADFVLSSYEVFDGQHVMFGEDARTRAGTFYERFSEAEGGARFVRAVDALTAFARKPDLPLSCSNQFFAKDVWQRAGGFSSKAELSTDHHFLFAGIRDGIVWIDRPLFHKRRHAENRWRWSLTAERCCRDAHYLAALELPDSTELFNWVVHETLKLTRAHRRRKQFRIAFAESWQLARLGFRFDALIEAAKIARDGVSSPADPVIERLRATANWLRMKAFKEERLRHRVTEENVPLHRSSRGSSLADR